MAIDAKTAREIEERLAELTGVDANEIRDWARGHITAGEARRTGWRFVRGAHGGTYVRDPDGHDILPAGYDATAA